MKKYWEIYNGRSLGIGELVCAVVDEEIADDMCKRHPKFFKVPREIKEETKNED